jgi:hypothetical protein
MKKLDKQKKLAQTLIEMGIIAFFAWLGWGVAVGLYLHLNGHISGTMYMGISVALLALFLIGVCSGDRLRHDYEENIRGVIPVEDILKEEGLNAGFYPKQKLGRDEFAYLGLFKYSVTKGGKDLVSGFYNDTPFMSSFLSISTTGMRYSTGRSLYRGRVSLLSIKKAFSGKTLLLCKNTSETPGLTEYGCKAVINSTGFKNRAEIYIDPLRYSRWSVYSDDEQALTKLFAKESESIKKLNESKIDFILCSSKSIIFGSQNSLIFDRYGASRSDVEKSTRESIQSIIDDFSCVLTFREMAEEGDSVEIQVQ